MTNVHFFNCNGSFGAQHLGPCNLPSIPQRGDTVRILSHEDPDGSDWVVMRIDWEAKIDGAGHANIYVVHS